MTIQILKLTNPEVRFIINLLFFKIDLDLIPPI